MIYRIKTKLRNFSHSSKFVREFYLLSNRIKVNLLSGISDEKFAKLKYRENTGEPLNLSSPTTYNEKLWWLKINNRDPLMTVCSDKVAVREYVKEKGLEHILTEVYGVYDNAKDVDFTKIPEKAIIKCNHGSGTNILFSREKDFNRRKFIKKFNRALKNNYYLQSREWNYKNIKPKILVEEFLEDTENVSLIDYRFMCFDGKVKLVLVDINTMAPDGSHAPDAKRNVYDINFNYVDMRIGRENFNRDLIKKPVNWEKMIEYAEVLAKPFVHCRVDLYNIKGKIYFGEITFYPGGATQKITPLDWDKKLGSLINLNSSKIRRN